MSFNRRRAAMACSYCRHRKRRCDATKPSCRTCLENGVECHYEDQPTQRIDSSGGSREIIGRLRRIEALLQPQARDIAALSDEQSGRHAELSRFSPQNHSWPLAGVALEADVARLPPLTIPVHHKTSSSYLLGLPAVRSLIGEYPPDLFFLLESRSILPPALSLEKPVLDEPGLRLDAELTDYLVACFFSTVHAHHPVLDEEAFRQTYATFIRQGPDTTVESALCLVVFALGAVTSARTYSHGFETSPPGMQYMRGALPTLIAQSAWSFSHSIQLPQALVLASVYFAYIVRPLHSWKLMYTASTVLQFQLSGPDSRREAHGSETAESTLRLFWSCFLIECDRLAELELPRSALQQLSDETALPACANVGPMQSTCYLAEISIRRLLNRVHNSLYPRHQHVEPAREPDADEISSIGPVCDELHRQLELWHASIPEPFRPSLHQEEDEDEKDEEDADDRRAILRIRYFATKHIIYRPFLLHVAAHETSLVPDAIIEKAGLCIESCRLYLRNATQVLQRPSQYTWTFSLSSLGAIVVLTLASLSPHLRHLVPDIDELQTLTIDRIRPWAISSLEAVLSILQDVQRKQRLLSRV